MQFFEIIESALSTILIPVNILLIFTLIYQYRESQKPILTTHLVSNNKKENELPDVLESSSAYRFEHHYIRIINSSKNEAKKLDITYRMALKKDPKNFVENIVKLDNLNSSEMTWFLLHNKTFREKFPDEFETITIDDKTTLIRPKESLDITLDITIRYNPLFFNMNKYELNDNYIIRWSKLESDPYVLFDCWNQRNGLYIQKLP